MKVRIESDAVWWIDVYALDFVSHAFALCERCHDLQAVAEYHAVRPIGVVLVELCLGVFVWQSVEVGEQVGLGRVVGVLAVRCLGLSYEVLDDCFWVYSFLDVQRRRFDV